MEGNDARIEQTPRTAVKAPEPDVRAAGERQQDFCTEPFMVDIAAGRCKPFRRSLLRPKEKIVHMEHRSGKPLRKLRSKRRFARAAVAVNGKDPARRGVQFFVQL